MIAFLIKIYLGLGELFIRFTVRVFHGRLSICDCPSLVFGFWGVLRYLVVKVPRHCLSFNLFHYTISKTIIVKGTNAVSVMKCIIVRYRCKVITTVSS